jgi:hypothetical protein
VLGAGTVSAGDRSGAVAPAGALTGPWRGPSRGAALPGLQ